LYSKENIRIYFNTAASQKMVWKKRNRYYHRTLERYFSFLIPPGSSVLEMGCGTGDLLAAVKPRIGVGIDFSGEMIAAARKSHPNLHFIEADIEETAIPVERMPGSGKFDYIILSDVLHILWDVQKALQKVRAYCHPGTRVVISNYNFLWEPILKFGELIRLKQPSPNSNWLSHYDIFNLLEIEGFSVITNFRKTLLPKYVPVLNYLFNRIMVNLPLVNIFGLTNFIVAKPRVTESHEYSLSIIIPARNERGNIAHAIQRTPVFGKSQEFIFVEGHSSDGTWEEILTVQQQYPEKKIKVLQQSGKGKGNAVREGFDAASGEVLMILDADLTTPPEELPKFYRALADGRGEFINGCRLVYPMEKEAMRFLNLMANKFFGWLFSYLLGQRLKDTLCGTKVLLKSDYLKIQSNRSYFGDFDPFGDFDLLFGASRLNLKITEILVRYKERTYGSTQISRFRHGWLLLKMSMFAAGKIKFI
jgi:SAM-dependent methyltransferase